MRRPVAIAVLVASVAAFASCRDDTVHVSFRPEVGRTYLYETRVRTETEVVLEGGQPEVTREDTVLLAQHTVIDAGTDGVLVEVVVQPEGEQGRRFVVRFDRGAQLESIERIEGIPPATLGELGISEIFPAAAGAPPERPLGPGERWRIDEAVSLPGVEGRPRLRGEGRLEELGVVDGEDVARIRTVAELPLRAVTETPNGALRFEGVQETSHRATHDLADGAVRSSSSHTVGEFTILLSPPVGRSGDPLAGTLRVEVRSQSRRLR